MILWRERLKIQILLQQSIWEGVGPESKGSYKTKSVQIRALCFRSTEMDLSKNNIQLYCHSWHVSPSWSIMGKWWIKDLKQQQI